MEEWIEWMQRTLSEYYIYCQILYKQAKDVEILKDFLSQKAQKLKYKLDQVTNEKEDLLERENAEAGIKEYLAKQMQALNIKNVEKTHELVLVKQKLSEASHEYNEMKHQYEIKVRDSELINARLAKDTKNMSKKLKVLEIENTEYKDIFSEMKGYFEMVSNTRIIKK